MGIFDGEFGDGLLSVSHGFATIIHNTFGGFLWQVFPDVSSPCEFNLSFAGLAGLEPALQPRMNIWKKAQDEIYRNCREFAAPWRMIYE